MPKSQTQCSDSTVARSVLNASQCPSGIGGSRPGLLARHLARILADRRLADSSASPQSCSARGLQARLDNSRLRACRALPCPPGIAGHPTLTEASAVAEVAGASAAAAGGSGGSGSSRSSSSVTAQQQQQMKTADLCDAHIPTPVDVIGDSRVQVLQPGLLRDFGGRAEFSGQAATLRCHESNVRLCQELESQGNGRVLVVDGGGSLRCALLGDNLAALAEKNGWAGVIVHGAVRDTAALKNFQVGIKALAPCPVKSSKRDPGLKAVRVVIGGVSISPGDWIYADEDGVVVSKEALSL